jgi:hypothetical protein
MRFQAAVVCVGWLLAGCAQRSHEVEAGGQDGGRAADAGLADAGTPGGDAAVPTDAGQVAPDPAPDDDPPIVVRFVEVGLEAGLDAVQATLDAQTGCEEFTPMKCPFTSVHMTGGVAAADVDGDSWVDVYVTRLIEPGVLYRNRGDGTFEDVTRDVGLDVDPGSNGAAFVDVDGDGDLDLYLTNVLRRRFALYVNERGRFVEQSAERGADVASDFRHHGFGISAGDYDLDGFVDLHTTEWVQLPLDAPIPNHARLLRNRGASAPGHFEDATDFAGVELVQGVRGTRTSFASSFADMDGDGWPELLVVADFVGSRLYWNDGGGLFTDGTLFSGVGSDENGMGTALGDYDGDGDLDWFVSAIYDPDYRCDGVSCGWGTTGNRLYENLGDRQFQDVTDRAGVRDGGWGWGTAFFDYDNDGALDLVLANGVDFPNSEAELFRSDATRLWHNRGDGTFDGVASAVGLDDRGAGQGLSILDYDADGDEDVLIAQHEGRALLLRNDGGNKNAYLRVKLIGKGGNTAALGARVTLRRRAGEPPLVRTLVGGSQYLGQSESIVHFGLGAFEGEVAEIEVQWPTGDRTTLRDVTPRQVLLVRE